MAKKASSQEDVILAALKKAFSELPNLLPLTGKKSLFNNNKQAAQESIAQNLILIREVTKLGKKPTKIEFAELTEKGISRVVDLESPKKCLTELGAAIHRLGNGPPVPDLGAFEASMKIATEAILASVSKAYASLKEEMQKALQPYDRPLINTELISQGIERALQKIENQKILTKALPKEPEDRGEPLEEKITAFVDEWVRANTVGCQFGLIRLERILFYGEPGF